MYRWKKLLSEENGPTAVEYGILLGLIVVVSVSTLAGFGVGVHNIYVIINAGLP